MATLENQQQTSPHAAPSLPSGDHELRAYHASTTSAPRRLLSLKESYLTPYLGLYARLSQVWINRWTILLLLVLVRTLFAIASIDDSLTYARREALHMCTSVEHVGSAMASMPHYMSTGVNALSAHGIEKAIDGLKEMLLMGITAIEQIIVFIINLITQTYVCLITLAVSGSLHVAVTVAEELGDFLNSSAKAIGEDLGDAAQGLQKTMNGFLSGISDVGSFFTGKDDSAPKVDFSKQIASLNRLQLPPDYDKGLQKLNDNIPTFEQVNNLTQTALRFPFEEVKKLVNASLPDYKVDPSLFPVPAKEQLTFCSDDNGINEFFDGLVHIEHLARKIFLGVLITLAVLACVPMALREYRRYKMMQERALIVKTSALDPMDSVYIVSRPYTSTAGLKVAEHFNSLRRKVLVRWSVAYATTVPALFVLSLGVTGLFACMCQYILLQSLVKEVPKLSSQVANFSDRVVFQLNNASEQWAVGTNDVILKTNTDINHDVFGWVNTTTGALNDTLNTFVDGMTGTLKDVFGNTILFDAVMDVLNCLILLKVEGIQKGLTWASDHAHVDFPLLPKDTFSRGAMQQLDGSQPNVLATTGPDKDATDAISGAVAHVVNHIRKGIRQEAIISTGVVLIWVVIVLIGVARAAILMLKGGNENVFVDRKDGGWATGSPSDHHELKGFFHSKSIGAPTTRVPTYEQAVRESQIANSGVGKYHGQDYTLRPNPAPVLDVGRSSDNNVPSPHFPQTGFPPPRDEGEQGASHNADGTVRRPTHARVSSYGDYYIQTPASGNPMRNPQGYVRATRSETKEDPFEDPRR